MKAADEEFIGSVVSYRTQDDNPSMTLNSSTEGEE